jgi:hypothetical protein
VRDVLIPSSFSHSAQVLRHHAGAVISRFNSSSLSSPRHFSGFPGMRPCPTNASCHVDVRGEHCIVHHSLTRHHRLHHAARARHARVCSSAGRIHAASSHVPHVWSCSSCWFQMFCTLALIFFSEIDPRSRVLWIGSWKFQILRKLV